MNERPKVGEFCWNELATPNVKAAKDFYGKLLGWKFTDHEYGDMTYTMIEQGDKQFGGMWAIPKDQQNEIPPHWMTYILVANVDESLQKALQYGAQMVRPATDVSDMGRFAIITDPTGAHIALWQVMKNM